MKTSEWKAIAKAQQVIIEKALERIAEMEAEVERLQRRIAELERLLTLSSSPLTHQGEPGVNPSGDTLGKERDYG